MKTTRIFGWMAAICLAFTMSSCDMSSSDNDSGSNTISVENQKAMCDALKGSQTGAFVYYNPTNNTTDTIPNITATITTEPEKENESITGYYAKATYQFPISILKNWINDKELAEAISKLSPINATTFLVPANYENSTFYASTRDMELGDITTSSKTYKKVTIKYAAILSSGGYEYDDAKKNKYPFFNLWTFRIYVDGNETSYLNTSCTYNGNTYVPVFRFSVKANEIKVKK